MPRPPGVSGSAPRIRINAQAANASIQDTSPPVTPTTRRHTTRSRKTVRCPTSVAAVRTCQRRRRSSSAPERNRASPSPPQVTGPRRTRRNTRFVSRATRVADPAGPLGAGEREREGDDRDDEDGEADESRGTERRMILVDSGQKHERDDGKREIRELVPDPGDSDGEGRRRGAEAPGAKHRVRAGHSHRGAGRCHHRERSRRLRHDQGLAVAEPRQRRHPARRKRRDVQHRRCRGAGGRPASSGP